MDEAAQMSEKTETVERVRDLQVVGGVAPGFRSTPAAQAANGATFRRVVTGSGSIPDVLRRGFHHIENGELAMPENTKLIQSYVWHGDEMFFVSTIERDSSAIEAPMRYLETMAWRINPQTRERKEQVAQAEGYGSHFDVCRQLMQSGEFRQYDS